MDHYYAIVTDDNELKHYGVKGMHWGIRRYQPYTSNPRKGGKTGRFIGKQKDAKQGLGVGVAAAAAGIIGLNVAKSVANYKVTKRAHRKAIEEAEVKRKNEEYQTKLDEYKRSVKNKKWTEYTDEEKKWSVSESKRRTMLDNAKKKDEYDMEFLETIQNDYYLSDDHPGSKQRRLSEYKKYLDNPLRYFKTHQTEEDPPSSDSKGSINIIGKNRIPKKKTK